MEREYLQKAAYAVRLAGVIGVMMFVGASYVGCEEEPSRPASCGSGRFVFEEKTNICRRLSDNAVVDQECCNY